MHQSHFSGFNFAEIQNFIQNVQQRSTALTDNIGVSALLLVKLCLCEQVCHAHNAIHRGPQLMAHNGEKFRFSLISLFCRFFGADNFLLIGVVPEDDNRTNALSFIKQRGHLVFSQKA
ncbi:hypothetical protein D3C75_743160 [compost metagenome]